MRGCAIGSRGEASDGHRLETKRRAPESATSKAITHPRLVAAQAPRPASLAGKGGRAGACHDARGCVVTNLPTRCSGALVKLQSQFGLRLFGVETASLSRRPCARPTCSDCDIRTGKSPSNVIGRKHLPSVTKIPQGNCKLGLERKKDSPTAPAARPTGSK